MIRALTSLRNYTLLFLASIATQASAQQSLKLDGEWRFALDPNDYGINEKPANWNFPEKIQLPGKLTEQGFGNLPSFETPWTGGSWRYPEMFVEWQKPDNFKYPFTLQPPRHYLGPAWYQRDITIPASWEGQELQVMLERPHWETTLWVNDQKIGGMNSLGTPHRYNFGALPPGKHTLTLRIDNRQDDVNVGGAAHSISDETQGNWNGVVGKMELRALPSNRIERVDVYPSNDGTLKLIIHGKATTDLNLNVSCTPVGKESSEPFLTTQITSKGQFSKTVEAKVPFTPELWSEFSPALYDLSVSIGENAPSHTTRFGFREMENRDGILTLNGKRVYLRGTLDCAIFPRLGHPPTEIEPWMKILRTCQNHGLNHIRFHSWCPPKAAFIAADQLGVYFQVEASAWSGNVGSGTPFDAWLEVETELMRAEYGNHACFVMMAYGNEPHGKNHAQHLVGWVARQTKTDDRRLYTTAAGWPVHQNNGFQNPFQPRIQRWGEGLKSLINAKAPQTDFDFNGYVQKHRDAPIVSHEIGQWCAYPNFDEIEKYDGYFKARNFEIFRETARRNGLFKQSQDFLMASGKWQTACYKHDIEAALRTPNFGGFQLLSLSDFTGQGTALVGVLDAFWDEKGYISPEEFHQFSSEIVPLARLEKMVFTNNEILTADLQLSHFGPKELSNATPRWKIASAQATIAEGSLPPRNLASANLHDLGSISVPLKDITTATKLTLILSLENSAIKNSWDIFVYPETLPTPSKDFTTTSTLAETLTALDAGKKVLWLAPPHTVADDPERPLQIGFSTIFWNTAYTSWQPPHTLGLLIDQDHPSLSEFPTDTHTNWQYWEIVTRSRPFILTEHQNLIPIIQPIDDWFTNRKLGLVFEAKVGNGTLLACSADLTSDLDTRPAARQLRHSLEKHLTSPAFNPTQALQAKDLKALIAKPPRIVELGATITASSQERGFEAANTIDAKTKTLWHSRFTGTPEKPPHTLTIAFPKPTEISAFLITQRQDGNRNGRLSEVEVLDEKGSLLTTVKIAADADQIRIPLPEKISSSKFTLRFPSVANGTHAAIAELDIVTPN